MSIHKDWHDRIVIQCNKCDKHLTLKKGKTVHDANELLPQMGWLTIISKNGTGHYCPKCKLKPLGKE